MAKLPSRLRRLDEILYDLPDDAMLLSELDGYLAGIAICPEPIAPDEWLPPIWGGLYGEAAPFEDQLDSTLFADMVVARLAEIRRDLGRARFQPILDADDRGDVLWEVWIGGFAEAMAMREGAWQAIAASADAETTAVLAYIQTLAAIADNTTALTSIEVNHISDAAPGEIAHQVARLYAACAPKDDAALAPSAPPAKVGRNDPCPCGSGKKSKKCCGAQ